MRGCKEKVASYEPGRDLSEESETDLTGPSPWTFQTPDWELRFCCVSPPQSVIFYMAAQADWVKAVCLIVSEDQHSQYLVVFSVWANCQEGTEGLWGEESWYGWWKWRRGREKGVSSSAQTMIQARVLCSIICPISMVTMLGSGRLGHIEGRIAKAGIASMTIINSRYLIGSRHQQRGQEEKSYERTSSDPMWNTGGILEITIVGIKRRLEGNLN